MATEQKVEARPRKWLTPVTLVLLKEDNSYGYELMERIEEEFGFEPINAGSVYRALRQMEKEGLCSSEWDVRAEEGLLPPQLGRPTPSCKALPSPSASRPGTQTPR